MARDKTSGEDPGLTSALHQDDLDHIFGSLSKPKTRKVMTVKKKGAAKPSPRKKTLSTSPTSPGTRVTTMVWGSENGEWRQEQNLTESEIKEILGDLTHVYNMDGVLIRTLTPKDALFRLKQELQAYTQKAADLWEKNRDLKVENDRLSKKLKAVEGGSEYCTGEYPCEAGTSAAELEMTLEAVLAEVGVKSSYPYDVDDVIKKIRDKKNG